MARVPTATARVGMVGVVALVAGVMMIAGVTLQQALNGPAFADSTPYETFCPGTPLGAVVLNDVVVTGALSPASPSVGQSFSLTGFQTQEQLPASVVQSAEATGLTSLTGSLTTTIDTTGATPASLSTGTVNFTIPLPNPVPPSGVMVSIPSVTVGPFMATSPNIAVSAAPESQTMDIDGAGIGLISLHCSDYPNDSLPSGFTNDMPPGLPISPVIATAGQVTPPPPSPLTGAYELYCPHTPVGDLVFNDVTTSATIAPATLSAGDQFQVTGYQTDIPIPPGAVTAAVGLGNGGFDGLAASYVDAYGTTSSQLPTGSMGFSVPIPNPVPSTALPLDIPSSTTSVGPFTALGGPVTIAQDQSILVVAELSSKAFTMSCTAYPNDSVAASGPTATPPAAAPIRPVIATASASGTPITTTTTPFRPGGPGPGSQKPGAPYELYCPRTPVGDIVVNDVVTTGSISPSSLNEGDAFQITNLETQITIPQAVAQQAENLGLTTLSGNLSLFLGVSGAQGGGIYPIASGGSGSTVTTAPGNGVVLVPFPGPFAGQQVLSFSVTLPSPVPSTGVQFTATPAPGSQPETFVATGGPISVFVNGSNLNVLAFGDRFGLFCGTLANDTVPTGLSIRPPGTGYVEPLVTTASATVIPPPPSAPGAYELYCPGTPVGNLVMNDATSSASLSPADPSAGQQFQVTGYGSQLPLPAAVVSAAAALGNTSITGSATTTLDAVGATPASLPSGTLSFDVPIPNPVPSSGVVLSTTPVTVGPFTATGGTVSVSQNRSISLTVSANGSDTAPPASFTCTSYRNDTILPSGITLLQPFGPPVSPVLVPSAPTLAVTPSTGLSNGESVSVTGAGDQANALGAILECNTAAGEPTVALGSPVSAPVPIGCTAPTYNQVTNTSSAGTISATYTVTTGTQGPPCGAANDVITPCPTTDSAGQDPTTDAANYPCPPTAAQQASGATCIVLYGDENGDRASAGIQFGGSVPPPPTTTPGPPPTIPPGGTTGPYELYCPGTPVGNIALNGVTTTASIPTGLSAGQTFNASNFQTQVTIPSSIASAAAALGNTAISGTAVVKVDASGATPATISAGDIAINVPLPSPIPSTGITLNLPSTPGTVGPFTATGDAITLTLDPVVQLTLVVSGSDLGLTCKPYTNNSASTGITSSAPPGSPISPVIATEFSSSTPTTIAGTGAGTTTTSPDSPGATSATSDATTTTVQGSATTTTIQGSTTSDATTTTIQGSTTIQQVTSTTVGAATKAGAGDSGSSTSSPIVQASSGSLAFTGPGTATGWIVTTGAALVVLGLAMLILVDAPRRFRWALARRGTVERVGPPGAGLTSESRGADSREVLWVDGP